MKQSIETVTGIINTEISKVNGLDITADHKVFENLVKSTQWDSVELSDIADSANTLIELYTGERSAHVEGSAHSQFVNTYNLVSENINDIIVEKLSGKNTKIADQVRETLNRVDFYLNDNNEIVMAGSGLVTQAVQNKITAMFDKPCVKMGTVATRSGLWLEWIYFQESMIAGGK